MLESLGMAPDPILLNDRTRTMGAAQAAGQSGRAGWLSVGHMAHAIVPSHDMFRMRPQDLLATLVDNAIVGGEVVYSRESAG